MRKDLKETNIHFTEGENTVFVFTCNTDLKKRLMYQRSELELVLQIINVK